MKSGGVSLIILFTLLLCPAGLALAQDPDPASPTKTPERTSPDIPGLPGGYVVVAEDDVQILVEGIEMDLRHAQDENAAGRSGAAAKNLLRAAAAVRLEMSRAPRSDRSSLMAASDSTEAVAAVLRKGGSVTAESIQRAAVLTHYAVAQHLMILADDAWQKHDYAGTGEEFQSSLEHFAAASDWLKGGIATSVVAKYDQWVQLAGTLRDGETGWSADQVRTAFDEFRTELRRLKS